MCACGTCVSGADIQSRTSVGFSAPAPVQYTGPVTFAAAPNACHRSRPVPGRLSQYAAVALLGAWSTIALRRKCAVESL